VKRVFAITLGILTAIGGFVDIGDLVANATAGARFQFGLAWVVVLGVGGIIVYAEMAGRVAAVSRRPVFNLVRERLGPRFGIANLVASLFINFLTLTAEIAGVAIALSMVASVNYILLVPFAAALIWIVMWRVPFERLEQVFGLAGLALLAFVFALVQFGPDWGDVVSQVTHPSIAPDENVFTYAYFAIGLFGAAMTPYEVFFFSSGAVEEGWTRHDLALNRANVYVGFPLGGVLSLAIMAMAALVLAPLHIGVDTLPQVALPVAATTGKVALAAVILGIFAATFGAALETGLSTGYCLAQYFGWQWGKFVKPRQAARFHLVVLLAVLIAVFVIMTGVDPVLVTEYSIVLSAAALPLTYFPILVVSNDPAYMGEHTNGAVLNTIATLYFVLIAVIALATIPLMIITKGGA
jgi:Mn2+/Fe2+ NRAMP family transporter